MTRRRQNNEVQEVPAIQNPNTIRFEGAAMPDMAFPSFDTITLDEISTAFNNMVSEQFSGDGTGQQTATEQQIVIPRPRQATTVVSPDNLTVKQSWVLAQLEEKNQSELIGAQINLAANRRRQPIPLMNGTILDIITTNPLINSMFIVHVEPDDVHEVLLYQFEIVKDLPPRQLTEEEKVVERKNEVNKYFDNLANRLKSQSSDSYSKLNDDLQTLKRQLRECALRTKSLKVQIATTEKRLKTTTVDEFSVERLLERFQDIAKINGVNKYFITKTGFLNVLTKPLHRVDEDDKEQDELIGRMHIKINLAPSDFYVHAVNLDYVESTSHFHPNVSATKVCLGSNEGEVRAMIKSGEFYQLIDFLITFFSFQPQPDSSPYVDYNYWREHKRLTQQAYQSNSDTRSYLDTFGTPEDNVLIGEHFNLITELMRVPSEQIREEKVQQPTIIVGDPAITAEWVIS